MALVAALFLLFISFSPTVETPVRPTAADISAAREVWSRLRAPDAQEAATEVRVDNRMIRGISALASDATGIARFEGEVVDGELAGRASLSLPLGLWLNTSATVKGEHEGFPAFGLKVGRVPFPEFAGRWMAGLGRFLLGLVGVDIPPLDTIVSRIKVEDSHAIAKLTLPHKSGLMGSVIAAGGQGADAELVAGIRCRITGELRGQPPATLPQLVRIAFDPAHSQESPEYTRAAFVALAQLLVGGTAEALAPKAIELAKNCASLAGPVTLQGRDDLAKHWAFSAGLTAVLGEETAASLGEWKELDDSLANGSGFSFVDLAADRSGMHMALRALSPETAPGAVRDLRAASEDSLLPKELLHVPEGLAEASFVDRFGGLDRARYREAVVAIDRTLAGG